MTLSEGPILGDARRHEQEVAAGERFQFGKNWQRFLTVLNDERINRAVESLRALLRLDSLQDRSFVDVGSGSGLSSLAARRLGAKRVFSFDYDGESVACTEELRRRYYPDDPCWIVERASALDRGYLDRLGRFDVVYSWGVLHHTGAMWEALGNMTGLIEPGGLLAIAIYNDQGPLSKRWRLIKKTYNVLPRPLKTPFALGIMVPRELNAVFWNIFRRRPLVEYIKTWTEYQSGRGMSRWHDLIDWVGGYPFEVASPDKVFHFYRDRGLILETLMTVGDGLACNQYVFRKPLDSSAS